MGRGWVWLLALFLACASAAAWSKPIKQPRSRHGLPLTLRIINQGNADASVFRVVSATKREPHGTVYAGSSISVTAFPRQKWVVYFQCRKTGIYYTVPNHIAAEWRLPRKPCRR